MRRPIVLATAASNRMPCIRSTSDHVWISDRLVANAFHAFVSRRLCRDKTSVSLSSKHFASEAYIVTGPPGQHLGFLREFHTTRTAFDRDSQGPKNDGKPSPSSSSLFGWEKKVPRFEHQSPSREQSKKIAGGVAIAVGPSGINIHAQKQQPDPHAASSPPTGTYFERYIPWKWVHVPPPKSLNDLIYDGTDLFPPTPRKDKEATRLKLVPKHQYNELILFNMLRNLSAKRPAGPLLMLPAPEPRLLLPGPVPAEAAKTESQQIPVVLIDPSGFLHEGMSIGYVEPERIAKLDEDLVQDDLEEDSDVEELRDWTLADFKVTMQGPIGASLDLEKAFVDRGKAVTENEEALEEVDEIFEEYMFKVAKDQRPKDSPPFPDKVLLDQEQRISLAPLESRDDIYKQLVPLLRDRNNDIQKTILIYSQIDAIYGIENLPMPTRTMDRVYYRLHTLGTDRFIWLFQHPSTLSLEQKGLLSENFWRQKNTSILKQGGFRLRHQYIDDPFRNPGAGPDFVWNRMKEWAKRRQETNPKKFEACRIPVAPVRRLLDRAIGIISEETWTRDKIFAVDTCIDIFLYFRNMEMPLSLLFTQLVKFMQAWMRHWGQEKYIDNYKISLGKELGSSAADVSNNELNDGTTPSNEIIHDGRPLVRRIRYQNVPQYVLSPSSKQKARENGSVPGLHQLLSSLPPDVVDRLIYTLLMKPFGSKEVSGLPSDPWTQDWTPEKLLPLAPFCREGKPVTLKTGPVLFPHFSNAARAFDLILSHQDNKFILKHLRTQSDLQIIKFHLRTWLARYGVRYYNDKRLLLKIEKAIEDIILRIENEIRLRPANPGRLYARAVLSFFYLDLPTESLINGIFHTLAFSQRANNLDSCLRVLQHFEGRSNGEVVFKVPKRAMGMALKCFHTKKPELALRILGNYHNRHNTTFADVLVNTAVDYPDQTFNTFCEFLRPMNVRSMWNPQIEYMKPEGIPSRKFLVNLAIRFALSEKHTPTLATRRIFFINHLINKLGYRPDVRVARALLVVGMIRTARSVLRNGNPLDHVESIFKHGRIRFAVRAFLGISNGDWVWAKDMTPQEKDMQQKAFIEEGMSRVWQEIYDWEREQRQFLSWQTQSFISLN